MNKEIKKYLSLVKFSHTIFAMPFALIGFFIAIKTSNFTFDNSSWKILLFIVLCMVFARNAAMGFNRYIDRVIDKKNPRTAIREIPAGDIKVKSALAFIIINVLLFVVTTWFINRLVFFLSPVALIVILGYSYTKKFTSLCHFILGLGLSLSPIGAYLSVTGEFAFLPILFSLTVLFWTSGFDIIYSLQDEEFDKSEKLKSIPAYIGKKNALLLSSVSHLLAAIFVLWAGLEAHFSLGVWYWVGAVFFIGSLLYQHTIVKANDLSRVNLAFFTTNGLASIVFAAFTISSLYL